MPKRPPPLFLVGAGFGADARALASSIRGKSIYIGEYEIDCGYPMLDDLPRICFPDSSPAVSPDQVENRLADALGSGDSAPIKRLYESLMEADYYLATRLLCPNHVNPYRRMIDYFPESSYLSFNYDSFLEYGLFRAGRWSPHDGYGVPVDMSLGFTVEPHDPRDSRNLVLHLHGSLLVYTECHTFGPPGEDGLQWMKQHDPPKFMFDPHRLGTLFYPCTRVERRWGYDPDVTKRAIAPVPEKADGLRREFLTGVRSKALKLLRSHPIVVSIGYSFSPTDGGSYGELLAKLSLHESPRVVLVVPEAVELARRLAEEFPGIVWDPQGMTFAKWVERGYPGVAQAY